ncbi:GNAT family N-acetyltransferase [Pseudochryseolinea flava]|uniref:N-acetyltransferase domain-containing protein n=1 Tax=Pseudochryseolinea flava TaxID=2059302 RepID=A0A364Y2H6_9BACT|nr:GNAT family N-acetyltransferase [Pseudochryseolinea flava]RAW00980.1 hypothetical protein DQQ10_12125 [Pseudochryseolinea flava]
MSISIRPASILDSDAIALLHCNSWRTTYRGILADEYLDDDLYNERQRYWYAKIQMLKGNEFVLIAEEETAAVGFIAVLDKPEAACDAFIDNLHVRGDVKGKGIGANLMKAAAEILRATNRHSVYLWVLNGNNAAAEFYKRKGAVVEDSTTVIFGGKEVLQTRFVWRSLEKML